MTRTRQATNPPGGRAGSRTSRARVMAALMVSTALVALDATIVATAVPSIVAGIGGFRAFPWLFSAYLLAQAVTVPVYGRLADLLGRKPVILFGIGLFALGSVLCGVAWSMPALIAFRALQGVGAGSVQPMSMTIVGDLYNLPERPKVQGYLASVLGVCSVAGPTLGGLLSQYASWRWIFVVNIPLCVVAAALLWRSLVEEVPRGRPVFDVAGTVLLTGGSTLLVLALLDGGQSWAWLSAAGIAAAAGAVVLLGALAVVERRAAQPVLPLWLFRRRLLIASTLISAAVGAVVLGLTSYVPTYVQDVLGAQPLVAGFALAALMLGWPLAAWQSGRVYLRYGFRACACLGGGIVVAAAALLALVDASTPVLQIAGTCFGIGIGLGFVAGPTIIAAQASVQWADRGVVTGFTLFSRNLGSALGIAVFGAVANATLGPSATGGAGRGAAGPLAAATQHVFLCIGVLAVLLLLAAAALPRRVPGAPGPDLLWDRSHAAINAYQ